MSNSDQVQTSVKIPDERIIRVGMMRRIFRLPEVGALVGAGAIALLFSYLSPTLFPTIVGLSRILDPAGTIGIMSVSVALLMIGGEFDLSAGVMSGSTGLIAGMLAVKAGWNIWPAMGVALAFALMIGFINGQLVTRTRLPSFIVTLATFFILRGVDVGVTLLVMNQVRVPGIDVVDGFMQARVLFNTDVTFGGASFWTSCVWWVALTLIAGWVLARTKVGSWIFAVGGDPNAARSVGVPVGAVKIGLFMTTAAAGWLVGMMQMVRLRSVNSGQGVGEELIFVVAAVVGGCRLTGGYGSVFGAAIGALIFGMASVGITFAGWDTNWYYAFLGGMLLVAVLLNNYTRERAERPVTGKVKPGQQGADNG
ncbi:MAG TPA: ABC transporter permease [Aggregatilineales bacterium]|nr:ABC transporter permease [Aggregatilineales bacterium]